MTTRPRRCSNMLVDIGDEAERILLVGHNPSLQTLGTMLASAEDPLLPGARRPFPTAAAVLLELPVVRWADLQPGAGRIVWFLKARELDH